MDVGFALLHALDAKDPDNHSGVAVHLNIHLFVDRLRRLIFWSLDARKKFAFRRNTAVVFDCDERTSEKHIKSFGVLGFDGVIPGGLKSKHPSAFIASILSKPRYGGENKNCNGRKEKILHLFTPGISNYSVQ